MKYPLVSIIIPCYNHEKYVVEALNSILDDTYPNKEIVVINDGSTDNSNNLINHWVSQHYANHLSIKYKNRSNKGLCATLNEMLELAKGKYVLPLASDDALYGNTIEQRVSILEENEKHGKLVLVSDALVIDENSNITGQSSMAINKGDKLKFKTDIGILKEMITNPSTVGPISLINKTIYNKIGLYPEDLFAEDWFFYQRAASIKAILFYDKVVSLYRMHSSNTSGGNISINQNIRLTCAIKTSIYRNISWYPTLYLKFLGVKKLIRVMLIILKLRVKRTLTNN